MTTKDDVVRTNREHPEWTARQIAEHLGIERHHVYNHARAEALTLAAAGAPLPSANQAIVTQAPGLIDITVVATRPQDMAAGQQSLIEWCVQKAATLASELADAQDSYDIAVRSGWRTDGLERALNRLTKEQTFYEKVRLALEAGYYIVPPFPIDIFTIRTDRDKPLHKRSTFRWERHLQSAPLLPAGDGRYVSNPCSSGPIRALARRARTSSNTSPKNFAT